MAVLDPRQSSSWSAGNGHLCNFDYYPWAPLGRGYRDKSTLRVSSTVYQKSQASRPDLSEIFAVTWANRPHFAQQRYRMWRRIARCNSLRTDKSPGSSGATSPRYSPKSN